MGWYYGQQGSARMRWRDSSNASFSRFSSSLPRGTQIMSFLDNVEDNKPTEKNPMLIQNTMSQADMMERINADSSNAMAVAIAAAVNLTDFSDIVDASTIKGLFLYSNTKLTEAKILHFLERLPGLESLTLMGVDLPESLLRKAFQRVLLPNLRYLETDVANDTVVAAMYTSPKLERIVFGCPRHDLTNDGFQRLVDAGGAKELVSIEAGTKAKHLSDTLTVLYLQHILPKFENVSLSLFKTGTWETGKFRLNFMKQGKDPKKELEKKLAAQDAMPFAVIPLERMKQYHLHAALRARDIPFEFGMTKETLRDKLRENGWTIEGEKAFQDKAKAESLQGEVVKLKKQATAEHNKIKKLASKKNANSLYPLMTCTDLRSALKDCNYRHGTSNLRRDDMAEILDKNRYQGGGSREAQEAYFRKKHTKLQKKIQAKETEIQTLLTGEASGRKRSFEQVS